MPASVREGGEVFRKEWGRKDGGGVEFNARVGVTVIGLVERLLGVAVGKSGPLPLGVLLVVLGACGSPPPFPLPLLLAYGCGATVFHETLFPREE